MSEVEVRQKFFFCIYLCCCAGAGEGEERVALTLIFLAATVSLSDRAKAHKNALPSGQERGGGYHCPTLSVGRQQ